MVRNIFFGTFNILELLFGDSNQMLPLVFLISIEKHNIPTIKIVYHCYFTPYGLSLVFLATNKIK